MVLGLEVLLLWDLLCSFCKGASLEVCESKENWCLERRILEGKDVMVVRSGRLVEA